MEKNIKQEIIAKYATHEGDTGSPEVQIALLTYSILRFITRTITRDVVCCKWLVLVEAF